MRALEWPLTQYNWCPHRKGEVWTLRKTHKQADLHEKMNREIREMHLQAKDTKHYRQITRSLGERHATDSSP